jgi:drug/metabolite transporter (DMT)-like permease
MPSTEGATRAEPGTAFRAGEAVARAPSRARIVAAFAAVYIIWGSTYLAIHFAIQTLPPFLMAGVRFLIAGAGLYVFLRLRGMPPPARELWAKALIVGALLLLGGNGAVVWSQQYVPTGVAALLVAIVPCWMVLLEWLRPNGTRPTAFVGIGLLLGTIGIAILIGPDALGGGRVEPIGAIVLVIGSFAWASGSIYSRSVRLPASPVQFTAMQMLCGGACLLIFGLLQGEAGAIEPTGISARSVVAVLYLIVFGSLIGYSAYIWLLRVSTPAKVATYAYVNPVVAVLLGSLFAGEALTGRMMLAAAVIVTGVAVITTMGLRQERRGPAMR